MDSKFLNNSFDKVASASADAVAWFNGIDDPEVTKRQDEFSIRLCRLNSHAKAAYEALPVNTAVGVFGPSQAGKSYLVSTLASTGGGEGLVASWSGEEISFVKHLNPQGGDREATGLVTRFTHKKTAEVEGYPVYITVFNEADLVRVLVNSYFADLELQSDYLSEHDAFFKSDDKIKAFFKSLKDEKFQRKSDEPLLVTQSDIVAIADYVQTHSQGILMDTSYGAHSLFWNEARKIVESLNLKGRAAIYEKLWYSIPSFNNLFNTIAPGIELLGGASGVYAPLECFVSRVNGVLKQRSGGTLNDIAALKGILSDEGSNVTVALDESGSKTVEINFNVLAFATAEITFPLPQNSAAGNFDVLDFPGARSRNKYDLKIWRTEPGTGSGADNDGSEFVRRGKVGYLIERYCERHEIDVLLCCIGADKQQEVRDLVSYFSSWINENVGATPEERAKLRKIPLVGAFTRFDGCVTRSLNSMSSGDSDVGKTITTALEKFNVEWLQNWDGTKPFDQFFFVRKPNIPDSKKLYALDENGVEKDFLTDSTVQKAIKTYKEEIVKDPKMKHVYGFLKNSTSCATIDEVLRPNDGGVSYLAKFLIDNFDSYDDGKSRTYESLVKEAKTLRDELAVYASEEGEKAQREARAKAIDCALKLIQCDRVAGTLADIRQFLEIDEIEACHDYLDNHTDGISDNGYRFAKALTAMYEARLKDIRQEACFEELIGNILTYWDENLRIAVEAYPDEKKKAEYSFFLDENNHVVSDPKVLRASLQSLLTYYTNELLKSYRSLDIEREIVKKLEPYEKMSLTAENLVDGQTSRALQVISDFNTYLDFCTDEPNDSVRRIIAEEKSRGFFNESFETTSGMNLPRITTTMIDESASHYYNDYFSRFAELISFKNLTAESQYNINPDQNRVLCEILSRIDEGTGSN